MMELHPQKPWILPEHLLLLLGKRSKHLLDHVQLIYLIIAREKWLPISQLAHYTADCPEINRFPVVVI